MFNKVKKLFIIPAIATVGLLSLTFTSPVSVHAQESSSVLCDVFPFLKSIKLFSIDQALCFGGDASSTGSAAATTTASIVRLVLQLIFVGIIIIAVYVIIKSAIKYIRSEGDPSKVEEAQKAIKTVFVGVAALFIGILGVVLVLAFFNAGGAVNTDEVQNTGIPLIGPFLDALLGNPTN